MERIWKIKKLVCIFALPKQKQNEVIHLNLHHHRNRAAFEAALMKAGLNFIFEGYGVGMYDPCYKVESLPDDLPNYIGKNVWIQLGEEYPFNNVINYKNWLKNENESSNSECN